MKTYYKVHTTMTGRNCLNDEPNTFDDETLYFDTIEEIREHLKETYGIVPGMKNKIYTDNEKHEPIVVGFLHSFWNRDYSHNSQSWYQTDWITIYELQSTPIDLSLL